MARLSDLELRELVRVRYAAAASHAQDTGCECESGDCCADTRTTDRAGHEVFGAALYAGVESEAAELGVLSLGCGVPTAVADLRDGEIVLDLGSGAGADVLISATRVGPQGLVIGIDMTDEMLELARSNAAEAGIANVRFVKGYIEELPLPSGSVDVVISNCVLNLVADKTRVLAEAARVLCPGGRIAVSDVIADSEMDNATRADMQRWTGCIAGALTREEFESALFDAGFAEVEIAETHRVHEHACAAIIRARRASDESCCPPAEQAQCCAPEAKSGCCGSDPDPGGTSGCR